MEWIEYDLTLGILLGIFFSYLVYRLQRKHTLQTQRVEVFWRYRKEILDNQDLRNTIRNIEVIQGDKLQPLLDLYEEIGLHVSRDLIDLHLTDEILGDDIVTAYKSQHVNKWINNIRRAERDETYYVHFMTLGKQLNIEAQKRKDNE